MNRSEVPSGKVLPIHFKPKEDELLSSWICRLAFAHGLNFASLYTLILPQKYPGPVIMNRDIDRRVSKESASLLSRKTNTSIDRVTATTLSAYEGFLFEHLSPTGRNFSILPVKSSLPNAVEPGMQYCPRCLAEGETYYRRTWRLVFITLCTKHNIQLADRCVKCAAPVFFPKAISNGRHKPPSDRMAFCYSCKTDLRVSRHEPVGPDELAFQTHLEKALIDRKIRMPGGGFDVPLLYFPVLNKLMSMLAIGERAIDLRRNLCRKYGIDMFGIRFTKAQRELTQLPVGIRRQLVGAARRLLINWPDDFLEFCNTNKLSKYSLISGLNPVPDWFRRAIYEH